MSQTTTTNAAIGAEITRNEARKLSNESGQRQEPYRGYGYELKDGRFLCCAPNGRFYVREAK